MTTMLILTGPERVRSLVFWASRVSASRKSPLNVMCCFPGQPIHAARQVTTDRLISGPGLLRVAQSAIQEFSDDRAELWELRHPDLIEAIIHESYSQSVDLLIAGLDGLLDREDQETWLAQRLLRFATMDTLLIDPGPKPPDDSGRILIPVETTFLPDTLMLARYIAGSNDTVSPLLVGPDLGADSRVVALKELEQKLQNVKFGDSPKSSGFSPDVVIANRPMDGIVKASQTSNMVLWGAKTDKLIFKLRRAENRSSSEQAANRRCAAAVYRPARSTRRTEPIGQRFRQWMPKMGPTDRVQLFDRLQAGTRIHPDFLFMMAISTSLAAVGLILGSPAVVIGAMLVAPLMTPLIGAGFALIQGNIRMFRQSIGAMALGIVVGLLVSVVWGLIAPKEELTLELMARATPSLADFIIAVLSGMAAAYVFARPGLMGTLAGVAIAAALVPPLATVGIGLSFGLLQVAEGAAILHITNLAAIILGAALVFWIFNVQGTRLQIGPSLWARRTFILLILIATLLTAPLGYRTAANLMEGQTRPMYFPLSGKLTELLLRRIYQEPDVDVVFAGRSGYIEEGKQVRILLTSSGPISHELRSEIREIIKERLGEDATVKVWVVKSMEDIIPPLEAKPQK